VSGLDGDWALRVEPPAIRDLDRLPAKIAAAVAEFLTVTLPANPTRISKALHGDLAGYRSARRGEYRVLLWLDEDTHAIHVVRVRHRRDAYGPPPRRRRTS
jgi:mRNA-degrading endonuclease RelE of RelBE toxin-antitoxin system